jgi:hypothetical protein
VRPAEERLDAQDSQSGGHEAKCTRPASA